MSGGTITNGVLQPDLGAIGQSLDSWMNRVELKIEC